MSGCIFTVIGFVFLTSLILEIWALFTKGHYDPNVFTDYWLALGLRYICPPILLVSGVPLAGLALAGLRRPHTAYHRPEDTDDEH
jgi:hypothetical protein